MNCGRCGQPLKRGAAHINESSCIEALQEALEEATQCRECKELVPVPLHPRCLARAGAKYGAVLGVSAAERFAEKKVQEILTSLFDTPEDEPEADQDPDPRRRPGRWKPR